MGRVRPPIPRHRLPLHRRALADPSVVRRWALVAVLAIAAGALTARVVGAAEAARADWGETRTVLVTERSVATGEPVEAVTQRWPVALAPPDALTQVPDSARAAGPLGPGMPLTATAIDGADGTRPDGVRLALPAGTHPLPLEPGDRLEVWTTVDPSLTGSAATTRRVAADVVVADVDATTVVVSADRADVAALAEAVTLATITLVATG